jgi:hypothetical protein
LSEATRTLWGHRDFPHLWSAQAVSAFGSLFAVLPLLRRSVLALERH